LFRSPVSSADVDWLAARKLTCSAKSTPRLAIARRLQLSFPIISTKRKRRHAARSRLRQRARTLCKGEAAAAREAIAAGGTRRFEPCPRAAVARAPGGRLDRDDDGAGTGG